MWSVFYVLGASRIILRELFDLLRTDRVIFISSFDGREMVVVSMRRCIFERYIIFVSLENKGAGYKACLSLYINLIFLNNRSISIIIKD
jgi:hypothetical protein